jgi:hypothetical protein
MTAEELAEQNSKPDPSRLQKEIEEKGKKDLAKEEPGADSDGQRVVPFTLYKIEKRESKIVRKGQAEI